ncbi:SIR2 family protein [Cellulosilyticum sp. I15G10I2]|uniref:SIR2 family protein n=1 Tax=Cellulosilyticum sp. I15G10I2 TaxID=1892843 RepID=UPI00085C8863|nr:SIR2 family protein [Cellulosilyticum sp. I15G10I2]
MSIMESELPKEIKEAWDRHELVVFIGAGISRLAGCKGWDELANNLIKGIFNFKQREQILSTIRGNKELITIAYKEYCKQHREEEFYSCLKNSFASTDEGNKIYNLIKKFNCLFLTTNADGLLESVLPKNNWSRDCNISRLQDCKRGGFVFYLHGRYRDGIEEDKESLVFTVDQYLNKYSDQVFLEFIEGIFATKTVLFLGYGLNEFELLDHLFTKIGKGDNRKRYFILEGFCTDYEALRDAKRSYYESLGIELLEYIQDNKGYDEQYDILEKWIKDLTKSTFYNPENIIELDEIMKTYSEESTELVEYYLALDNENKITYNEFMRNISKSEQYEQWLEFAQTKGLFKCEYSPTVIRKDSSIRGEYWEALQMMLRLLDKDTDKSKLSITISGIIEEIIPGILANEDLKQNWHIYHDVAMITFKLSIDTIPEVILEYLGLAREAGMYSLGYCLDENNYSINTWDIISFEKIVSILLDSYKCEKQWNKKGILNDSLYRGLIANLLPKISDHKKNTMLQIAFSYFSRELEVMINRISMKDDIDTSLKLYRGKYMGNLILLIREICRNSNIEYRVSKLNEWIQSSNECILKLTIYLCTKLNVDYRIILNNSQLLKKDYIYPDFYIYLEKSSNQFKEEDVIIILNMIDNADFGENKIKEEPYTLKRIKSRKAALYKILSSVNEQANQKYQELKEEDIWKLEPPYQRLKENTFEYAKPKEFIDLKELEKRDRQEQLNYINDIYEKEANSYWNRQYLAEQLIKIISCERSFKQEIFIDLSVGLINDIYQRLRIWDDKKIIINQDIYSSKGHLILSNLKDKEINDLNSECIKNILLYIKTIAKNTSQKKQIVEKCWMFLYEAKLAEDNNYNDSDIEIAILNTYQGSVVLCLIENLVDMYSTKNDRVYVNQYIQNISDILSNRENIWLRYGLAMNVQNLYYMNKEWTKNNLEVIFCHEGKIDMTAIRLAIGHTHYIYQDLTNLMVDKQVWLHFRDSNWNKENEQDLRYIHEIIRYMVTAHLFKQCEFKVIKSMIDIMKENEYIALFEALNQKVNSKDMINYDDIYYKLYTEVLDKKNILDRDTIFQIINTTAVIDGFSERTWQVVYNSISMLQGQDAYWYEFQSLLERLINKNIPWFTKILLQIFEVINDTASYEYIESIMERLLSEGMVNEAKDICRILISQGKVINQMKEWGKKLGDDITKKPLLS